MVSEDEKDDQEEVGRKQRRQKSTVKSVSKRLIMVIFIVFMRK